MPDTEKLLDQIQSATAAETEETQNNLSRLLDKLVQTNLPELINSWKYFDEYEELVKIPNYTQIGNKTPNGMSFRKLSRDFATHLDLQDQIAVLAEEFYNSNTSSPITYRKPDDRKKVEEVFNSNPENNSLSDEERKQIIDRLVSIEGIKRAIELTIMTTAYSCYRSMQGDTSELVERLNRFSEQDARYVRRLLSKHIEGIETFKDDTKLWSIPYEWNIKILEALKAKIQNQI